MRCLIESNLLRLLREGYLQMRGWMMWHERRRWDQICGHMQMEFDPFFGIGVQEHSFMHLVPTGNTTPGGQPILNPPCIQDFNRYVPIIISVAQLMTLNDYKNPENLLTRQTLYQMMHKCKNDVAFRLYLKFLPYKIITVCLWCSKSYKPSKATDFLSIMCAPEYLQPQVFQK